MKDDSDYRSLTPKPGWIQKICERCHGDFWLTPAQDKNGILYCKDSCRHEPPEIRFWKSVTKDGPMHPTDPSLGVCWNSTFTPKNPYPHIKMNGRTVRAARFILELTLGRQIGEKLEACHSCDNSRCVNPSHIREGTRRQNSQECVDRGRHKAPKGETHSNAKLTEERARDIKFNPEGLTGQQLAEKHSISESQVSAIRTGRLWSHLKE